jgi:hypothetical protein
MNRDSTTPTTNALQHGPYLPLGDCTIRWQRGDTVAHIVKGKCVSVLVC